MLTQAQRDLVVACCRDLVRAQSLPGKEAAAADALEAWMRRLGYDDVWRDRYGSVVGRVGGGAGPRLHFDGHLDTVPATALDAWTHPPFAAELSDGKVWGRGATDMKGPVAAMACAAAFLARDELRGTVTVSGTVVEEELEGQVLGALLAEHPAEMVVIGESTLLQVGIGQKGRAGIRITTHGRPAHSSVPHLGDNAAYRMVDATQRLRALPPPDDDVLGPGILELVEIISSPYPGTSIIPDRCSSKWDRRLVRGETRETVFARIRDALGGLDHVDVGYHEVAIPCYTGATIRHDDFHPAWAAAEGSPLVRAALRSVEEAGVAPRTCAIPYCTNGSGSAGELGIPTIVLGPGDPDLFHVVDEYISVEQLELGVEVHMNLARRLVCVAGWAG